MELKLVTLLKELDSIFIDTSPFIYYIEECEKYLEVIDPLFSYISQGHIIAYTSFVTFNQTYRRKGQKTCV